MIYKDVSQIHRSSWLLMLLNVDKKAKCYFYHSLTSIFICTATYSAFKRAKSRIGEIAINLHCAVQICKNLSSLLRQRLKCGNERLDHMVWHEVFLQRTGAVRKSLLWHYRENKTRILPSRPRPSQTTLWRNDLGRPQGCANRQLHFRKILTQVPKCFCCLWVISY